MPEALKTKAKVNDIQMFDSEKLFALQLVFSKKREVQLLELFINELSPVPSFCLLNIVIYLKEARLLW